MYFTLKIKLGQTINESTSKGQNASHYMEKK